MTLSLALERGDISAGGEVWATLSVENRGDKPVSYQTGGCKVLGRVEAAPPAADAGRTWTGALAAFKAWAMQNSQTYAHFIDEESWGYRAQGFRACPAIVWTETLPPGTKLTSRWIWDGYTQSGPAGRRPAQPGSLDVRALFHLGERTPAEPLIVRVPLEVRGSGDPLISAGVAIDRAYEDGRLARWLDSRPAPSGTGPIPPASFAGAIVGSVRLDGDVWLIHAAQKSGQLGRSSEIDVRVAARDGRVLSVEER